MIEKTPLKLRINERGKNNEWWEATENNKKMGKNEENIEKEILTKRRKMTMESNT